MSGSPFHEGERAVQERLGVREAIEPWARRVVRPCLPEPHRAFLAALPFLIAAARDRTGRPWATVLAGAPGFARSPDPERVIIQTPPPPGDPLAGALVAGAGLGLLAIDLATRRRNRVNGTITAAGAAGLALRVGQSFGNCPQHIRERDWRAASRPGAPPPARRGTRLSAAQRRWIAAADTFFIASGHRGDGPAYGMDAAHRGGDRGFVRLVAGDHLVFPDFAGNNHFNTLGNLMMDPRAGLLFVDFERGGLLHLTGRVAVDWEPDAAARAAGARRLVHYHVEEVVERAGVLSLRWSAASDPARSLRVVEKRRESADVSSLVLAAPEAETLPGFTPGQHLPVELRIRGHGAPLRRTYSLSGPPGAGRYRISVRRDPAGIVSRHLHDAVEAGALVDVRNPAGDFVLAAGERPVVLLGAGVGATPLLAMLHALAAPDERRPVLFVHGVRDRAHHPFADEVRRLAAGNPRVALHFAYSRPGRADAAGRDYDHAGRADADRVARLHPGLDADFYLCGPTGFLADLSASLGARGVCADRVHTETFGPAG